MNEPQFEAHSVPEFLALATKFTKQWFPKGEELGALVSRPHERRMEIDTEAIPRQNADPRDTSCRG